MIRDCEKHSICPVLPVFTGIAGLDRYSICPVLPVIYRHCRNGSVL